MIVCALTGYLFTWGMPLPARIGAAVTGLAMPFLMFLAVVVWACAWMGECL